MSYVKTDWIEMSMTEVAKLTALNNMETQYDEITSYAVVITHDLIYYDETYTDANFFTASNDGAGSGLIASTFEGLSYDDVVEYITLSSIPAGCILIWNGLETEIPLGFKLCNGANGTPNLLNKYPVAAGGNYTKGQTGGNNLVTISGDVTIAGHLLTGAELPPHTHTIYDFYHTDGSGTSGGVPGIIGEGEGEYTTNVETSATHNHNATFAGAEIDIRPESMALCYIMKEL